MNFSVGCIVVEKLNYIIEHYGYFGIVFLLIGGIVGLPIPDEFLLTFVGFNVFKGKLAYIPALLSAFAGASGGISLSYFIGHKFGLPLLHKYGPKFHITEEKINYTNKLFSKVGPVILLIGYFIPGIRHLSAYIAAINDYPLRKFVFYAYTGAFIWTFTFITLGRILGKDWVKVRLYAEKYSLYLVGLLVLAAIGYFFWKKRAGK
ncbi:DedA family protein [Neobacillus notoginsengisoli]|uniref:DedA family protein n=1 Tax=Neobacillus notoginsengisoli TaxID=1578198 RepID=A0A417YVQ4_9BACI|nr:DedA family protein [Neobacillus notoginsengisoli]RHW41436.1 DedA family protein [Neobacillus notoginsengisoli]